MALERPVLILNQIAGEDFSSAGALSGYQGTGQYLIVKQNPARTNNTVVHCNSVKDRPRGIAQGNPAAGDALGVMAQGVSKVVAGGVLSAGDAFGTDSSGRAVRKNETNTGANYGDYVLGEVVEGATALGQLATVILASPYRI